MAVFTVVTGGLVLWRARIDTRRSLSMHVGDTRWAIILFAAASVINAVLLTVFMTQWFMPVLQLHWAFGVVFFVALGAQVLSALVPHTTGLIATIHIWSAYVMAVLMVPILMFLPFSPVMPMEAGLVIWLLIIAMTTAFLAILFFGWIQRNFLWFQIGYVLAFWVAITLATFVAPESGPTEQKAIPMDISDFNDDPRLLNAIESQLHPRNRKGASGDAQVGHGCLSRLSKLGACATKTAGAARSVEHGNGLPLNNFVARNN